ncbi:MAG: hypothetical protein ACM3W4_08455 [Ignavibacteriales bacterium]
MSRTAAIVVIAGALALAACGRAPQSGKGLAPEQPALWSIASTDGGQPTLICADAQLRNGFTRTLPTANGQPCRITGEPVVQDDMFAARCRIGDDHFKVNAMIKGDRNSDFTVDASFVTEDRVEARFERSLHYRKLGACPEGWTVGDSGVVGERRVVNTLSHAERQLPAPVAAPAR